MTNEYDIIADTLNEIIERAEDVLVQLGFNVEAQIPVLGRKLAYTKHKGRWRLVWIEEDPTWDGDEGPPKTTLVLDSSRELRLEAAREFPTLYRKIAETERTLTENARTITENFDMFVGGLEEDAERDKT